ncbi:MAG: FixH family protein [Gemmatimonadetes bacterium]|nr:FixH family protein [Gemmatimonadota bacterium]
MTMREKVWPTLVVGALTVFAGGTILLARIAASDPHASVEPDYYRKAVAWDSTMAQERRNVALGWQLTPALPALGAGRTAPLTFDVRDAHGAPVTGASVHVEAMAVAQADSTVSATLGETDAGRYVAQVPIRRAGLWELRVSVVKGADKFTADVRLDAARDVAARAVDARPGDVDPARLRAGTGPGA